MLKSRLQKAERETVEKQESRLSADLSEEHDEEHDEEGSISSLYKAK